MAKQIRQKIVKQESVKAKKNFKPGQAIVGVLITIVSLFLLFIVGIMFLMSH